MSNVIRVDAEHSIDLDLLPETPTVLDVGCRGFAFDVEILKLRPKARIIALDPDPIVFAHEDTRITFLRAALTDKPQQKLWWQGPGDGGYIVTKDVPGVDPAAPDTGYGWGIVEPKQAAEVTNIGLEQLMSMFGVKYWDLVKLDCEGSEFGLLEKWPRGIATQLSVEFHDFANPNRWNAAYFDNLLKTGLRDYEPIKFGLTPMGSGNHMGHWDTLFTLKGV